MNPAEAMTVIRQLEMRLHVDEGETPERKVVAAEGAGLVERGEYPDDEKQLARLVEDICDGNAARFIGIDKNQ